MKKGNVKKVVRDLKLITKKHSPGILTGMGVAGMVTTTVLAVRATPKALTLINQAEDEKGDNLTPVETVKACWKCYIPAATTGIVSTACLIGANSVHARRNAALATAYKLSETALSEYRDKVVETIGEKKEKAIRDEINKDKVDNNPVSQNKVILTDRGNTLCYDPLSDRYFKSDIYRIEKAQNIFNKRLLDEMYLSLNEFYDEIDLKHIDLGEDVGWEVNKGFMEINFSSQITDDGTPCVVIDHLIPPHYGFNRIM